VAASTISVTDRQTRLNPRRTADSGTAMARAQSASARDISVALA
jgi:hypothetical protein